MTLPALQNTSVFFRRILSQFPQDISLAFAYGSAVFKQAGTAQGQMGKNMLDFVFAVDDPVTWHTMNLIENRKHYSFLKYLGPKQISSIQNDYGAGVYFNTLVPSDERLIKYGVISTDALIDDLLHWKTMYIAGRLHKPVRILLQSENGKLRAALVANLKSAVNASFLMLPESFSEEDLFLQIAGLSYSGDFRMVIGEDKSKVSNIVKDNMQHFRILYNNILQDCPQVVYKPQQGRLEVDKSPEGQFTQLMALPRTLQQQITRLVDPPGKNRDVEEILLQVAQDPDCGLVVQQGIYSIVKSSSITQSAKGIITAGEAALRGEPRMQPMSLQSAVSNHRTGPPPISPSKRKHSGDQADDDLDCSNEHVAKMSRLFAAQLGKPANGDYRKDPRDRSRSPIERAVAPTMSLHGGHLYAHMPSLAMDQPLALTKNNMDAARTVTISPTVSPVERQQNRPSVITCAPANNRNCNLSHCTVSHNGCSPNLPANYRRPSNTNTACDPVIEEHFRRSLGKNYKEPEPVTNSVSITGSVDDHFAKALGETWLQIKAKGSSSGSPDSSPNCHMVNHNHSPSLVS